MFSYRHAYHAGNHADVLKHFVQVQLHQYMNQKDTAYTYIDTHSGAGVYALDSAQAVKSGEYLEGIARLWERDDLPAPLADYVKLVRAMNPSGRLRYYPGSPYVAEQVARPEDRLRLFELHPADTRLLVENFRKLEAHKAEQGERSRGRRILIEHADGFQALKSLLPPPSRRALVLIDPPYEVKLDYKHVRDRPRRSPRTVPVRHLRGLVPGAAAHGVAPVCRPPEAPAGQGMAARDPDAWRRRGRTARACTAAACSS
jgi:23S rRNA (adenine2030-N6)-methyltransferase